MLNNMEITPKTRLRCGCVRVTRDHTHGGMYSNTNENPFRFYCLFAYSRAGGKTSSARLVTLKQNMQLCFRLDVCLCECDYGCCYCGSETE